MLVMYLEFIIQADFVALERDFYHVLNDPGLEETVVARERVVEVFGHDATLTHNSLESACYHSAFDYNIEKLKWSGYREINHFLCQTLYDPSLEEYRLDHSGTGYGTFRARFLVEDSEHLVRLMTLLEEHLNEESALVPEKTPYVTACEFRLNISRDQLHS